MFRPRLYQIKTNEELFTYFYRHAGYIQSGGYECAGLVADDTRELYQKLIKEWKNDVKYHNEIEVPTEKILL